MPVTESVTEPVTGSVTESVTEPVTEACNVPVTDGSVTSPLRRGACSGDTADLTSDITKSTQLTRGML